MMKTIYSAFFFLSCFLLGQLNAQEAPSWHPVGDKIRSPWAGNIDPANPLPEYPRPQLVREQWQNLNGLWDYAIVGGKLGAAPSHYDGPLLVTFRSEEHTSELQSL